MTNHSFTFIVSGVDAHADDLEDRFFEAGCDDATRAVMRGFVAVCFDREADNFTHAVVSAFRDVLKTGAKVERFEPDFLVSQSEIAARANISRAAVSQYVSGERAADFPRPKVRITSSSPLWDWVDVSSWLHRHGTVSEGEVVNARIGRAVNWFCQHQGDDMDGAEKRFVEQMSSVAAGPAFV
jgi:predicted DNA-binding transcriptional regulator AlpA